MGLQWGQCTVGIPNLEFPPLSSFWLLCKGFSVCFGFLVPYCPVLRGAAGPSSSLPTVFCSPEDRMANDSGCAPENKALPTRV